MVNPGISIYSFSSPSFSLTEVYDENCVCSVTTTGTSHCKNFSSQEQQKSGGEQRWERGRNDFLINIILLIYFQLARNIPEPHKFVSQVFLLTIILVNEIYVCPPPKKIKFFSAIRQNIVEHVYGNKGLQSFT